MRVNPMTWKFRNLTYIFLAILIFYVFFVYKKVHHVKVDAIIKNTKPESVWEFVADFSNMKKLNPTIEEFNIIEESGNYEHWKYSVHYKEHLSNLPYIKHTAHGHYSVKPDDNGFLIGSQHRTCFLTDFDCVNSVSEFRFSTEGADTKCVEHVEYECPIAFSSFCHKEVMYQREEIMKGLKRHFSILNIHTQDD